MLGTVQENAFVTMCLASVSIFYHDMLSKYTAYETKIPPRQGTPARRVLTSTRKNAQEALIDVFSKASIRRRGTFPSDGYE